MSAIRAATTASARFGPDDDAAAFGLDPHDIERFGLAADLESLALADGEMDDAAMLAEHAPVERDDLAALGGFGPDLLDDPGIVAVGYEADVLAVGLGRDREAHFGGELAHARLGQAAQGKAQVIELVVGRGEEEIALVARRIDRAVQFGALFAHDPPDIMAGGEAIGIHRRGQRRAGR